LMMLPLARSILAAMRQQHNIYKIEGGVILENQISCLDKRGHYKDLTIIVQKHLNNFTIE